MTRAVWHCRLRTAERACDERSARSPAAPLHGDTATGASVFGVLLLLLLSAAAVNYVRSRASVGSRRRIRHKRLPGSEEAHSGVGHPLEAATEGPKSKPSKSKEKKKKTKVPKGKETTKPKADGERSTSSGK